MVCAKKDVLTTKEKGNQFLLTRAPRLEEAGDLGARISFPPFPSLSLTAFSGPEV